MPSSRTASPPNLFGNRPLVASDLKHVVACEGTWIVTSIGPPAELIEAGVADALMLAIVASRNPMTGTDDIGDKVDVFRRAKGRVKVVRSLSAEIPDRDNLGTM